ncbi:MAG: TetR/AcrR family transcriptional regulator [Crocosphaera sp.]
MNEVQTKEKILKTCKDLIQTKGYHSLTINEIAKLIETSPSNIYHHFGNKENLVKETIIKYQEYFSQILTKIEQEQQTLRGRLEELIKSYAELLEPDNQKICLCITLIIEINTLPASIIKELNNFIDLQVDWITKIFQQENSISNSEAAMIVSALEGFIAIARLKGGSQYFKSLAYSLIENFLIAHQKSSLNDTNPLKT